jgi:RNA polymerase sigma factor (sigma-70 family)
VRVRAHALHVVPPPAAEAADTLALRRVAGGDVGALGEIYDRHAIALLRFTSRAAGRHDAEDIVQATFIKAVRIAGSYDGRSDNARSWLVGIAARLIQERRRSIARLTRALARLVDIAPKTTATDHFAHSDLERGLLTLTDAKRVVIVLAEVEGYTCDEIARMLEIPVGTVWTRLHHARNEMRDFYDWEAP